MERVKILMQVEHLRGTKSSIIRTAVNVWKNEGFFAYWKGNGANIVRIIPNKGILFMCNDFYISLLTTPGKQLSHTRRLIAGCLSGATLITFTYPLDITQTRLASGGRFKGIIDCMISTIRYEGPRAIYKGYVPSLLGIAPYTGAQFLAYDVLTKKMADANGQISIFTKFLAGGISGCFAQSISYPMDTVRRRLQVQGVVVGDAIYQGTWDCMKKIFVAEGLSGFYRGLLLNALRAGPSQAVQFVTFGIMKDWLSVKD